MPWTPKDAPRHTRKAKSPKAQRQWAHVADSALSRGASEGSAIRQANAVVGRRKAAGGVISPLAAVAGNPLRMRATAPKFGNPMGSAGRMRMPRVPIADTMRNIDQHMQGARVKLPKLKARVGGKVKRYDEGGEVERRSSSPGSPGVSGAIRDALAALRDYFIESPRREIAAARQAREDAIINNPQSSD